MKTLKDVDIKGKTILVRADYNVPLKDGKIVDDFRLRASLPTLKFLIRNKCRVVVISHLGRPSGLDESLRLRPIAKRLSRLLRKNVLYAKEYLGPIVKSKVENLKPGEIILLENLRFNQGEELNDKVFAKKLAGLCDIFVNDAFSVSHREHASVVGIARFVPSVAGLLLEKEVKELNKLLNPKKPFVVLLGGAKLSTKLKLIHAMLKRANNVLIGGAMAFTFLKAKDIPVGKSLVEEGFVPEAKKLLTNKRIVLPVDFLAAKDKDATHFKVVEQISDDLKGLDIGPESVEQFLRELRKAKSVFWNGPLGYVENKVFAKSTVKVARELAKLKKKARVVVGGGDTVKVIEKLKLENDFAFVSTGGGASLKFLSGEKLPGLKALDDNEKKFWKS